MINITYGSITQGAKEAFTPSVYSCADVSTPEMLTQNVAVVTYGNPCEPYSVLLDGGTAPLDGSADNIGVWSDDLSDEASGEFTKFTPMIVLESDEQFTFSGLTLLFDTKYNVYPTLLTVNWYSNGALITSGEYTPTSPEVVIAQAVQECDEIRIVIQRINTPQARMKMYAVQYGAMIQLSGDNVSNLRVNQKTNLISTTVPVSSADIVLIIQSGADYDFRQQQTLDIENNGELIGRYLIDEATHTSKQRWSIKTRDYIYLLDTIEFAGGVYSNATVASIAEQIFSVANVPYEIFDGVGSLTVSGWIPYTTCRQALQQLLFAVGAYAKTSYTTTVQIRKVDYSGEIAETIPLSGRVMNGSQTISTSAETSEVELTAHTFTEGTQTSIVYTASEQLENAKITFSSPVKADTIQIGEGAGEIIERGVNYAVVTCDQNTTIQAVPYTHVLYSKTLKNPAAHSWNSQKKSITDATLVTPQNIDTVLEMCYNRFVNHSTTLKAKIVETGELLDLGNRYTVETEMRGNVTGVLTEQAFNLYGSKVVKEVVIA